jgi:hypothetical protein
MEWGLIKRCRLCGGERGHIERNYEYGIDAHKDCIFHHFGRKLITISNMKKHNSK